MHEFSVASSLMDAIETTAAAHRAAAVHRVHLRIGELSGIEIDLLESAFELVKERTICATASLDIVTTPARWECERCGERIPRGRKLQCPECAAPARMTSGDEIELERLELEVA